MHDLTGATLSDAEVMPDGTTHEVVKMMKVIQITRKPGGRIARFQLTNSAGKVFDIGIDEATVKAMSDIFTDDTAAQAAAMSGD